MTKIELMDMENTLVVVSGRMGKMSEVGQKVQISRYKISSVWI